MSATRPRAPWPKAASSISPRRCRTPSRSSAGVVALARGEEPESLGGEGIGRDHGGEPAGQLGVRLCRRERAQTARAGGAARGRATGRQRQAPACRRRRRGRRGRAGGPPDASATRPPADQPRTPTRSTSRSSRTLARSSAAAPTVDHWLRRKRVRAPVARPVDREQSHVSCPCLCGIGIEDAGARGAMADDDGALLRAATAALADLPGRIRRRAMNGDSAARLEHDSHWTTVPDIPATFCRLHGLRWKRARKPARLVPPRAPDPGAAHGRGARRAARGLGADGAARRAGARGGGRADRLGSGPRRRLPPGARLPHEAHRPRCDRGGGALRRPRCGARARPRARRSAPEAARLAARRSCRTAPAEPRSSSTSTCAAGFARRTASPTCPRSRERSGAAGASTSATARARPSSRAGSTRSGSSSRPASGTCSRGAAARSASTACRGSSPRGSARSQADSPAGLRSRGRLGEPLGGVRARPAAGRGHRARAAQPGPVPPRRARGRGRRPADGGRAVRGARPRLSRAAWPTGREAEVLAPTELRGRIAEAAATTAALYAGSSAL